MNDTATLSFTAQQLAKLAQALGEDHSLPLGKAVAVRTVTHYYTGKLVRVTMTDITLEDAAWIPDTGRWNNFLATGTPNEVEPFLSPAVISRAAIVDVTEFKHTLPRGVK